MSETPSVSVPGHTGHPSWSRPVQYGFRYCQVLVLPDSGLVRVEFWDRATLEFGATPDDGRLYLAESQGYGSDVMAMIADRVLLHEWLTERVAHSWSPVLWAAAHAHVGSIVAIGLEHRLVGAFQAYLRTGRLTSDLPDLLPKGFNIRHLAVEARVFLLNGSGVPWGEWC